MTSIGKKPLLSICIPTYNRAEYLKKSLDSIINSTGFNETDVEIVISDNVSTDATQELVLRYLNKYQNIKYFKNEENIVDKNFPVVLSRATGVFRKLCNDVLLFNKDAIKSMLDIVKENVEEKPVIFFDAHRGENMHTNSLEEFLRKVSFWIGSILAFGVWDDFCDNISDNFEGCEEHLWQVPFLLNYMNKKKNCLIIEESYCIAQEVTKKNLSYGIYKVFYENYLGFIKKYVNMGLVSQSCFDFLEEDLLFNFFKDWLYNFEIQNKNFVYSKDENLIELVLNAYKNKKYYKKFICKYNYFKVEQVLRAKDIQI